MPTDQMRLLDSDAPRPDDRQVFDLIGNQVLRSLGVPKGLRSINVRLLWENHYRANVVVGHDITTTTVAHSYFVVADAAGKIVTSNPTIRRLY